MTDDPFLMLIVEALNLTHPRFALANGREYPSNEAGEPPAARKVRERSFLMEFYHEFRRLWDKAVPVQRGLGHVVIQADPDAGSRSPDLLVLATRRTRSVPTGGSERSRSRFSRTPMPSPRIRHCSLDSATSPGYPHAVSVVIGRRVDMAESRVSAPDDVTAIFFDIDKWQASIA